MKNNRTYEERVENFWACVDQSDPDGCWPWMSYVATNGYGTTTIMGKPWRVHRFAYETAVGPVPDGLELDHVCHIPEECKEVGRDCAHRRCCNPAHLLPSTKRANTLRSNSISAMFAVKMHCPQGHPYDEENTRVNRKGSRLCITCERIRSKEWRSVHPEKKIDSSRHCSECGISIATLRSDALVCGTKCASKRSNRNRVKELVKK